MDPLLNNDRAKREWLWLCRRVGEEAAREAIARIPGGRKAFPLNIARALGVSLPEDKDLPLHEDERQSAKIKGSLVLEQAKRMLGGIHKP